ncbi:alkaline phosphatase family protein [Halomarina rubra]|uniref:Alkaline phosphatase family protein n=1 Tax=Halomarina rubra TaxID=2071873 RepID=A0ABD6AZT8_9EURY|nr:alkaline phosphatase family protein [Halomarina rubra]
MLRTDLAADLREDELAPGVVRPDYERYCFGNVPDTVLDVLGADARRPLPEDVFGGVDTDVQHVVVALVDGYGYEQWRRDYETVPLLSALTDRGRVTPLTSVFPSETAAAITTMQTGRLPCEHGILGWFQYHEATETVVQMLPFTDYEGTPLREVCPGTDSSWLVADGQTAYDRAADAGVDVQVVVPETIAEGAHGDVALHGATVSGTADIASVSETLRERLEASSTPTYAYGYFPQVDAAAHSAGTESDHYREQLRAVTESLRRNLVDALSPAVAERTLLVVTADHGHLDTTPEENVAIGTLDDVESHLERDEAGRPIPAVGSPRQLQFRVRDGHVEALRSSLTAQLDCATFDRERQLDERVFGNRRNSEVFERRLPDLLVVPRDRGVWYDDHHDELSLVGMHGGGHPDEMLVPFATARVSDLRE